MASSDELHLAVLIDAENVPYKRVKGIMEEISKYGTSTIKRIYADWTNQAVSGWKNVLLDNALIPIQQYSYTTGKNASDSAMIIDAMDILYSGKVEGFCIVSSDSDFTRLATRLREAGMKVFGIGERKTPNAFIVSCDKFIYIDIINAPLKNGEFVEAETPNKGTHAKHEPKSHAPEIEEEILKLIATSINDVADENGWALLATVGNLLSKKRPDFDTRSYGFGKLTPLIKSLNRFEIEQREASESGIKHIYVRNKIKRQG